MLGIPVEVFEYILVPSALFGLYMVVKGPRPQELQEGRYMLVKGPQEARYMVVKGGRWPFSVRFVTACLMVCVGTLTEYMDIPEENGDIFRAAFHTTLAFVVVGTLESIRQNVSS